MDGFIIGAKEDKLGIRGSYTHTLLFNDVKVPKIDHVKCQGLSWFGAKLWNSLPEEIKAIQKPNVFKDKVKEYISNHIPSY